MAFAHCILHISAFLKKEENRHDRGNKGAMKKNEKSQKKIESAVGDNMRSYEKNESQEDAFERVK